MLGPDPVFNVISPVEVICPVCGKVVKLTGTGGLSAFTLHCRRRHAHSEPSRELLQSIAKKEELKVTLPYTRFVKIWTLFMPVMWLMGPYPTLTAVDST